MAWPKQSGTAAKYRTKAHRDLAAHYKRQLKAGEVLTCRAVDCLLSTRAITNPNGMHDDGVTVGHMDDGITYRGPEHRKCNLHDAAVRARGRQDVTALRW